MGKLSTAAGGTTGTTPTAETPTTQVDDLDFSETPATPLSFGDEQSGLTEATYEQVVSQLNADLDRSELKQREGFGGNMLDYLEWTTVVNKLNAIFGYGRWSTEVTNLTDMPFDADGIPMGVRATVHLTVRFPGEYGNGISYENVGFSTVRQPYDKEASDHQSAVQGKRVVVYKPRTWDGYDMAVKGAVSDALKRCAVNLGKQFGLDLYGKPSTTTPTRTGGYAASYVTGRMSTTSSNTDGESTYTCEECGKSIDGYTTKQGKKYTAEQVVGYSKRDCGGHVLCFEHKQSYLNNQRG